MISQVTPSKNEKEQALAEVLESQALARSQQLKSFLRYVCELEIAGRAAEIKEYSIGTDALGRPDSYSPASDSSVRRRAFELRAKLEEIYTSELAASPILIDVPKGSYVPNFRFRDEPPVVPKPRIWNRNWPIVAALLGGAVLGALAMRLLTPAQPGAPSAVVREGWGPLAAPQGNVLLCIASGLQLAIRAGAFSPDSDLPSYPAPAEIYPLYRKTSPTAAGAKLFMRPTYNATSLGVVSAVAAASASLHAFGVQYQILPERIAPLASFRNRNVLLIGDPLNSFAAAKLLSRARLTIAHDPSSNRLVIRDLRKPPTDPPAYSRVEGLPGKAAEVYGLLTVLPSDSEPSQQRRTLIVSGVSNVGIHGAIEFFTSPDRMLDLRNRFKRDGLAGFPSAYQVVVRCTAENSLPLSCGYAAHYVLDLK